MTAPSQDPAGTTSSIEENKEIIRNFLQALTDGDLDKYLSYLDESVQWWTAGSIDGISGTIDKATYTALARSLIGAAKNGAIRLTPSFMIAEGQFVAAESESYIEFTDGRIYNNFYHYQFHIKNRRIVAVKEYMDTAHVIEVITA